MPSPIGVTSRRPCPLHQEGGDGVPIGHDAAGKEVLRPWLLGLPNKGIAAQLGFDVKTVRRYLAVTRACGVEASHGLAALDDDLVAAVLAATQPATGRPQGEGWAVCEAH